MSTAEIEKLEYNREKLELQIQGLNSELGLKELELKKIIKDLQKAKSKNSNIMNRC